MTQEIYIENIANILKNKPRLERELKIKITNKGKDFFLDGTAENEYLALKVFEAMELGFSAEKALLLKNETNILHRIEIKKITKRHDLERIRARIIGTHGKTIGNLSRLSHCHLALNNNQIGIIGDAELIDEAILAVKSIVQGSKQGNVYTRLEKETKKRRYNPEYNQYIKNELKKKQSLNN